MRVPDLPDRTLAELTRVFAAYPELTEVVLFGSRATGIATPRSDIDLATRGISDDHIIGRLALDLDDLPIPQQCDVQACEKVTYEPLRRHIESVGIVIYRKSAPTRVPLGQWLVENMPRGVNLEIPHRRDSGREIPFSDHHDE